MDKKKLILPASIIIGCFIIGGFIYEMQIKKQESIERQQILTLQANKEVEKTKADLEQKKYVADRKQDCLNIYKTEGDKYNNVKGWRYDEAEDSCMIRYKDPKPKTQAECDKLYKGLDNFLNNILCSDEEFENSF